MFLFFYLYDVFSWLKLVWGLKEMTDQIVKIVQHTSCSSERVSCLCVWRAVSHLFIQKGNCLNVRTGFFEMSRDVRSVVGLLKTRFDYSAEILIIVHVYIWRWCECVYYTLRCSEIVLTWCHLKVHVFLSNPHSMNQSYTYVS